MSLVTIPEIEYKELLKTMSLYNAIREVRKEKRKEKSHINREKLNAYYRDYYLKNKDKVKSYQQRWNAKNPNHQNEYRKKYYEKNRESILAKGKAYRILHHNEELTRERKYYASHRDEIREKRRINNLNMKVLKNGSQ